MRIFVFGSNEQGVHGAGAALYARKHHGAVLGQGVGRQGDSYAIPTRELVHNTFVTLPLPRIAPHVNTFIDYAKQNPTLTFEVTRIGCGYAGYNDSDMKVLFKDAPLNCELPDGWRC